MSTSLRYWSLLALWLVLTPACTRESGSSGPAPSAPAADPLPSWNEGPAKKSIIDFVGRVTRQGGPDFVSPPERIATFDNDGTLWSEQPLQFQFLFALDRVKALAPQHPDWIQKQPFKGVLEGDTKAVMNSGERGLLDLISATHAGNTTEEFERIVSDWIATARHPKFNRPYTEMVYQPMLEVLAYLRANGFKAFIVSGGGVEFMRPWVERVQGIPPEQVVGSRAKVQYEVRNGVPVLARLAEVDFIDDKSGKAGRDPSGDRPASHRRLWQFRRRLRDARVGDIRRRSAFRPDRAPHGRGARMGLRPHVSHRSAGARTGRGAEAGLDRR